MPLALGLGLLWAGAVENILGDELEFAPQWFPGLLLPGARLGLVGHAEVIRAGQRETQPLDDLMAEMDISREELNAMPHQPA